MLFASTLSNIIQAVLMLAVVGIGFYIFRRMTNKTAPRPTQSKSESPTATSDGSPTPDEIADDLAATLPDISEAIDADSSIHDDSPLNVGNLSDTADAVADLASDVAEDVPEETVSIVETYESTSSDDVLDEPVAASPTPIPASSKASLPPLPPSGSSIPSASQFPSSVAPTTSSIPPRRKPVGDKPKPATPIVLPGDEPDEIEVLSDRATVGLSAFNPGAAESDASELADLRLALEASHNELSHLTSQRDQAVTRAVQHEEELAKLRHELQQYAAAQEAMQQDRQRTSQLESELDALRTQVAESSDSSAPADHITAQHEATVNELRVILGQREAAEASLARERDNLAAQNEEQQRKIDKLESGAPADDDSTINRLASLELQHQQAGAELSLSNETVRQLNQNINQRDTELMHLRQQVQTLSNELEEAQSAVAEPNNSAIQEIESRHEASIAELKQLVVDGESKAVDLASQNEDLTAKIAAIESAATEQSSQANQSQAAELSLANETVRQLNQNISQRDNELLNLRRQVHTLSSELEESQAATTEPDESVLQEIESQHQSTVAELRSLLEEREAAAKELASQNETLQVKINEIESAKPDESVIQEIESRHEASIAELKQLVLDRESKAAELAAQNEELSTKITAIESAAKEQSSQADQSQVAELSLANETVRQLNQNINQRDAQLLQVRRELGAVQAQLEETRNAETEAPADESAKSVAQLAELEEARDQIQRTLEQAQQSCVELEVDRNRQRAEFESARQNLHEELAAAKEAQQTSIDELDVVKNQVNEQALVIEKLRDDRTALQSKVATSVPSGDIERLTEERDDALARYDKLQIDFAHAVKGPEEDVSEELDATRRKLREKSADHDALQAELHTTKARYEAETGVLRSKLESANAKLGSAGATESEDGPDETSRIAELESAIAQHEQAASGLQSERQDLLDRLGAAQEESDAKAAEMRRMREQLEEARAVAQGVENQQQAFKNLQQSEKELSELADTRGAELKRLQDEQSEIKQQLAHYIDAEEAWKSDRITLLAQAGLDENGDPIEGESDESSADDSAGQQQVKLLESSLAERDEALRALNERFEQLKQMYDDTDEVSVLHDDASDPADVLRAERDQAAAAAAEASSQIADLMTQVHQLKSDRPADRSEDLAKLQEENREYRRSVAELHAAVNELEEIKLDREREKDSSRQRLLEATRANAELSAEVLALKDSLRTQAEVESPAEPSQEQLDELAKLKQQARDLKKERDEQAKAIADLQAEIESTPQDRKEGAQAVRSVKRLTTKLEAQEKKVRDRDDRLQGLAAELSKMRTEATTLKNEVAEQQAIVRTLSKGQVKATLSSTGDRNGRATAKKKTSKKKPATSRTTKKTVKKKVATERKAAAPKKAKSAKKTAKPKSATKASATKKRPSKVDDLKEILGIGPVLEKRLNKIGIYRFAQVKGWSKSTINKIDEELGLGGRIQRDKWIAQAKKLAASS